MEQHPIPQQISSYEFKLVGEMTLKQFLKALAGIIVALLLNSTNMVFFIKWPLMLLFAGAGLALAFLPLEDRPLETWALAFIKSIYAPTIYTYKKRASNNWLDIDMSKVNQKNEDETKEEEEKTNKKDETKVGEFIMSLPSDKTKTIGQDHKEKTRTIGGEGKTGLGGEGVNAGLTEGNGDKKEESGVAENQIGLGVRRQKLEATGKVKFGQIPMPDVPEVNGVVVGMTTDDDGKIVEGAIIEIQDDEGNPVRVFKTNSLGQFKTVTPLAAGKYLIVCEREGYVFDRMDLVIKDEIVKPIKISAKRLVN